MRDLSDSVGKDIPQITPQAIANHYAKKGEEISLKTAYNYLNESIGEWIKEETKVVKSFVLVPYEKMSNGIPNEYLLDDNGNEIPPKNYPNQWTLPKGEKKLKSYSLTEKALQLIREKELPNGDG